MQTTQHLVPCVKLRHALIGLTLSAGLALFSAVPAAATGIGQGASALREIAQDGFVIQVQRRGGARMGAARGARVGAARGARVGAARGARVGAVRGGRVGAARGARVGAARGARVGAARGARVGAVRGARVGAVRGAAVRRGAWVRPRNYWWGPGGAIAAGAALGVVTAATAASWAGAAPGPGMCWYYTDPSRRQGFWDVCQ